MADALSVLFKIGRLPHMKKPEPAAIESALRTFLHETLGAAARGIELGIPAGTTVRYEVQWLDDIVGPSGKIPVHLSIRGPRYLAGPLHDKLKVGFVDGRWGGTSSDYTHFAKELGIPQQHPVEFKLYVRSATGEKFDT